MRRQSLFVGVPFGTIILIAGNILCSCDATLAFSGPLHVRRNSRIPTTALWTQQHHHASFTQVVSDVDDTLKSSGGVNIGGIALGGIDVQYERGEFYPGVAQFMLELSLENSDGKRVTTPPKVAILTARAEEFKAALQLRKSSKLVVAFREAGEKAGISGWGVGPVLYGSVAEWVVQDRKGLRKFSNFELLLEQDPTGTIMQVREDRCGLVLLWRGRTGCCCCRRRLKTSPNFNSLIDACLRLFQPSTCMSVILENWTKRLERLC